MSRLEIVPPELLAADRLVDFVEWLWANVPVGIDRKILMCEWCELTSVPLTGDLVDQVYEE